MTEQNFPPGGDEKRVREVLAHYESQSEDEQFAEIEAPRGAEAITMMAVPTEGLQPWRRPAVIASAGSGDPRRAQVVDLEDVA
jgi:hypothetical protein